MMQEAPIDSDDEGGADDTLPSDRSYHYLTVDDAKDLRYNSSSPGAPRGGDQDLFGFETLSGRQSTVSSVGGFGRDPIHEELRYMRDDTEGTPRYGSVTPSAERGHPHDEFRLVL